MNEGDRPSEYLELPSDDIGRAEDHARQPLKADATTQAKSEHCMHQSRDENMSLELATGSHNKVMDYEIYLIGIMEELAASSHSAFAFKKRCLLIWPLAVLITDALHSKNKDRQT